jgi:hypothetical protein
VRVGPIIDLAPQLDDFGDTAAAIAELDLVLMTDSAVAHLTGTMGNPVWVLLGHSAHWQWLLERNDSPLVSVAALVPPTRGRRLGLRVRHRVGRADAPRWVLKREPDERTNRNPGRRYTALRFCILHRSCA